ncbi:two component regulator propeller family protein (macronuclear) [Tetrahymena thermophila SB210]|uniref:Two component regulator propeller family protein n=1 Tax=Tetrahymena thermophila (strain SB210) TaxID=312017 RepID=Q22NR7_TETTS|nr:two component regulator propeller family protein [Tetrahymena thermophila SB210]EAR86718.1 two component regulator propeller family protein [Tetrahymena thermophila SB210]|eukprot:XP_001006963.1 two component regulator propeller family protein [Tetrahymena thermophila SB210]
MKNLVLSIFIYAISFSQILKAQSPKAWVYSSQYDYIIPVSEPQGMYNNIKIAYQANLVFVAAGDSGVKVLDPQKNYQVISTFRSDEYLDGFTMTQDAKYVFLPFNSKLTIFDYTSRSQFQQIAQDSVQILNVDMVINKAETVVFIFQSTGQIRAVNVSNKKNPTFAGTVTWRSSQIQSGLLSQDDQWLFVCQGFQGLAIYKVTYNQDGTVSFFLAGAFLGATFGSYAINLTSDLKYIINIDNKKGVSIGDFTQITNSGGVYKSATYSVTWWPTDITLPSPYSLCLSGDNNILFLGVLSQGIYVVDITDKTKPALYEVIQVAYQGKSIKLSQDESYLFYANGQSVQIFPKTTPNLSDQYLNLFNKHLVTSYDWSSTYFYWRCVIDDANKIYYGSFDDDGLWIFDASVPEDMKLKVKQFKPPNSLANIDIVVFLRGFQYIVLPIIDDVNVFAVYATNDIITLGSGATVIQMVAYDTDNYIVDADYDETVNLLAGALGNSVIFMDITTIGSFSIKTVWQFTDTMKGSCTGVMFTGDFKYLVGASRGYGYFVLDIRNLNNIQQVNYIDSLGAENLFQSTISLNYGFFVDGLQGIFIVSFDKMPQIDIISHVEILGWSNDVTFLNNEKLLLVSTLEQGMVTLVDISDIKNPFIVSEYYYENQNGMSTCAFEDNSYLFINNNIGVLTLPTISPVQMHVEVQQVLEYSSIIQDFIYKKMDVEDVFTVGMDIQLDIVFLYQPLDLIVDSIWHYQQQIMNPIPTWMTYDPEAYSINIQVVKEAIDEQNISQPLVNTIILKTLNPLYQADFNYNNVSCPTSQAQNDDIFNYILSNGYINDSNVVNPNLSFTSTQVITVFPSLSTSFNQCISTMIKQTLLNSIQYSPIYLFFKTSLIYTQKPADNLTYIQTVAKKVSVQLIVPKFSGKFIYENQIGVNLSVNSDKNIIEISGLVENVNGYLANILVLYAMPGFSYGQIKAQVTISDDINYDLQYDLLLTEIAFLKEKSPVQLNPQYILQDQFNQDYSNGEIAILTSFLFNFDQTTFQSLDVGQVTYTAYILQGDQFVILDTSHWISYYAESQKFYGTPPQSSFKTSVTIKLVGDDGYSNVSDTFVIQINKLPVLFVIQWISQILGPLIGALGMYKYRNIFYNAFFKYKNRYTKINAIVNQKFILKIPLISQDLNQAKEMIENLIQIIYKEKNGISKQINLGKIAKMNTLKIDDIENDQVLKEEEEQQQKKALKIQEQEQNIQDIEITNNKNNDDNHQQIQKNNFAFNTDRNDITNQFKDKIMMSKNNFRNSIVEKQYLNQEGKINMQQVIEDMLQYNVTFKISGKKLEAKAYKEELNNKQSSLYKCIKLLLARYFISLDKKSHLVSEYIKYYGKKNCFLHSSNDWYKQFVNIVSEDQLDINGQIIAFPKISLNKTNIAPVLMYLELLNSKLESFESISSKGINPHLLKLVLKADVLGINLNPPSSLFPSQGESLYIKPNQLKSVESFKYAPGGTCFPIMKFLNMEYDPYGPKENMQFPNWLELIMQSGVIILQGTPQQQDVEEILIRFYGLQGFIYRSFTLRVQDTEENYQKSRVASMQRNSKFRQESVQNEEKSQLLISNNKFYEQQNTQNGLGVNLNQFQSILSAGEHYENKPLRQSNFANSPQIDNLPTQLIGTPDIHQKEKILKELDNIQEMNLNE